jgi:hypothetical protein
MRCVLHRENGRLEVLLLLYVEGDVSAGVHSSERGDVQSERGRWDTLKT